MSDKKNFTLAVVPGDGIGPEVTTEALKVLDAVAAQHGVTFDRTEYDLGAKRWHATGETLPDAELEETRSCSARSATRASRPGCSSAVCCSSSGSPSTTT